MNVFVAADGRLRAFWRFLLGALIAVLANVIAVSIAATAGTGRRFDLIYRPLTMVFLILGFSLLLVLADRERRNPLAAMGLRRWRWAPESFWGLLLGSSMVTIAVVCIAVAGDLDFTIRINSRLVAIALAELFMLASAAMAEELMFRGYPFQRLVEVMGAWPAALVLSGLFGALHLGNPSASAWSFVNTVAVGVLLSLAYLRTRALWLPWGLHFGWNATLGMVFGLPVSGINDFAVLVRGTAEGPLWLTGGRYGIEASAVGTVVILAGLVLVAVFAQPASPLPDADAQEYEAAAPAGGDSHPSIEAAGSE